MAYDEPSREYDPAYIGVLAVTPERAGGRPRLQVQAGIPAAPPGTSPKDRTTDRVRQWKRVEDAADRGLGYIFSLDREVWKLDWFIKRMHWWKSGSRWHGRWDWEPYDRTHWLDFRRTGQVHVDLGAFNRAVRVQARNLPLEVLLVMVERAGHSRMQRADVGTLTTLALVCRTWCDLCSPELYHSVTVQTFRAKDFRTCVTASHSRIPRYAKIIRVKGTHPWVTYARLARLLPNAIMVHCLDLSISKFNDASSGHYYPSSPLIAAGIICTLVNVKHLQLQHCRFASSLHLLHILGSFPALKYASLTAIWCKRSLVAIPPRRPSVLRCIHTSSCTPLWPLALTWQSPHPPFDTFVGEYPGLQSFEAALVVEVLQSLQLRGEIDLFLDASHSDPVTWVAWVMSADVHLEFHVRLVLYGDPPLRQAAVPHIFGVVLRSRDGDSETALSTLFVDGAEGLGRMCDAFSQLPRLETLVLELRDVKSEDAISGEFAKQETLSSRLRTRTCEEAHRLALAVRAQRTTGMSLPTSPFWYLARHRNDRPRWVTPIAALEAKL